MSLWSINFIALATYLCFSTSVEMNRSLSGPMASSMSESTYQSIALWTSIHPSTHRTSYLRTIALWTSIHYRTYYLQTRSRFLNCLEFSFSFFSMSVPPPDIRINLSIHLSTIHVINLLTYASPYSFDSKLTVVAQSEVEILINQAVSIDSTCPDCSTLLYSTLLCSTLCWTLLDCPLNSAPFYSTPFSVLLTVPVDLDPSQSLGTQGHNLPI